MTRRQLRELERAGEAAPEAPIQMEAAAPISDASAPQELSPASPDISQMTRRQIRELGLASEASNSLDLSSTAPPVAQEAKANYMESGESGARRLIRQSMLDDGQRSTDIAGEAVQGLQALDAPEELTFAGTNLLAEPSTQSIVLSSNTQAIDLPLDTGEIVTTGSISIVSEPSNGPQTDGFDIDELHSFDEESITGVMSTVSPISAKELVIQRSTVGVVPQSVLRRGWWKPWALAAGSLGLVVTAILAAITILGAVGG
jgi:hypothetical protein